MTQRQWERYVAVGDSFTEGLMDPAPGEDTFMGWADRLAAEIAAHHAERGVDFGYANLAIRGRLIADIAGPQLDAALELTPDLVSFSAGGNDCLRAKVDIDHVIDQVEDAVARIRETGADVLMVTCPNVRESPIVNRVNPRMAEFTAGLWGVATRYECYVLDLWNLRPLRDTRMWAEDRIHFSSEGHARIAAQGAYVLGVSDDAESWRSPLAPADPLTRWESLAADRAWARTHLRPWIVRRIRGRSSGDGVSPKRPTIAPIEAPGAQLRRSDPPATHRPAASPCRDARRRPPAKSGPGSREG